MTRRQFFPACPPFVNTVYYKFNLFFFSAFLKLVMRLQFAEYTHSHVFFSYKKDNIDIDKKIIYISIIQWIEERV